MLRVRHAQADQGRVAQTHWTRAQTELQEGGTAREETLLRVESGQRSRDVREGIHDGRQAGGSHEHAHGWAWEGEGVIFDQIRVIVLSLGNDIKSDRFYGIQPCDILLF